MTHFWALFVLSFFEASSARGVGGFIFYFLDYEAITVTLRLLCASFVRDSWQVFIWFWVVICFIAQYYCTTICITSYFDCVLNKFKHFPQNSSRDILIACLSYDWNPGFPKIAFSPMTCIEVYLWSRHADQPRAVNLKFVALPCPARSLKSILRNLHLWSLAAFLSRRVMVVVFILLFYRIMYFWTWRSSTVEELKGLKIIGSVSHSTWCNASHDDKTRLGWAGGVYEWSLRALPRLVR